MTEMKRSFAAQVIDGAVAALKTQWPDVPIYTEFVEQGLQENAFSLRCIDAAVKRSVLTGKVMELLRNTAVIEE